MAIALPKSVLALASKARFHVRYPGAAVEISPDAVTAVLVRRERGGTRVIGYGVASLTGEAPQGPPDLAVPRSFLAATGDAGEGGGASGVSDSVAAGAPGGESFSAEGWSPDGSEPGSFLEAGGAAADHAGRNAPGEGEPAPRPAVDLKEALVDAVKKAGIRPGRCSLILPDSAARVWLLQFPEIPRGQQAVLEMIRWKVRRSIAMKIEDCLISYQIVSRVSAGQQGSILVGLLPRAVVQHHESLLAGAGLKIGLVDLSSF